MDGLHSVPLLSASAESNVTPRSFLRANEDSDFRDGLQTESRFGADGRLERGQRAGGQPRALGAD